jgi:hypothetical protein
LRQQKLISDTFGSVRAFEMKLKLRELLENMYISSCDLLYNGGSISVPFPSVLHSMADNFQMRFTAFHSHAPPFLTSALNGGECSTSRPGRFTATNIRIFQNSSFVEVHDAP